MAETKSTFENVRRGDIVLTNGKSKKVKEINAAKGFINFKNRQPDGNRLQLVFEDNSRLYGQEKHSIIIVKPVV